MPTTRSPTSGFGEAGPLAWEAQLCSNVMRLVVGRRLEDWRSDQVEAFISRRVMDSWVYPRDPYRKRGSLRRAQYNALGNLNLAAIERIAISKYQRGAALNRQHPFVDILLADIMESDEALDTSKLAREPRPPAFERIPR